MPAIITSKFRLDSTEAFIDSLQGSSDKYYLGIGRAHAWATDTTPDTPYENDDTENTAWEGLFAAKKLDSIDSIYATVRKLWVSGTTYSEYDDQDTNIESKDYFVISDNNNVYICLKSGGTCTVNPDIGGVTTSGVIDNTSSDGYIWKYLFTVPVDTGSKFLTASFIPIHRITTSPAAGSDTALLNQWAVQTNAIDGGIYNIKIVSGGTGYTSAPTVTITGSGSSATATATVTSGVITDISVTNPGSGYNNATITVTGGSGSGGSLRAVISPNGGFGKDARNELRAHYVAINKVFNGDESNAIVSTNDFRQIALLKNPVDSSTSAVATGTIYDTTSNLVVATGGSFAVDAEIEGINTGTKAIVVEYDSVNGIIYYNQNVSTGYGTFVTTENVRLSSESGSGQDITAVNNPGLDKYSGDILFLENRTAVSRGSDQIETIRLVIAF
jgi:hypothetical protein